METLACHTSEDHSSSLGTQSGGHIHGDRQTVGRSSAMMVRRMVLSFRVSWWPVRTMSQTESGNQLFLTYRNSTSKSPPREAPAPSLVFHVFPSNSFGWGSDDMTCSTDGKSHLGADRSQTKSSCFFRELGL